MCMATGSNLGQLVELIKLMLHLATYVYAGKSVVNLAKHNRNNLGDSLGMFETRTAKGPT